MMVTSITTRSDVLYHFPTLDPFLHILSLFAFVLTNRTFQGLVHLHISRTLSYTIPQRIHSVKP